VRLGVHDAGPIFVDYGALLELVCARRRKS